MTTHFHTLIIFLTGSFLPLAPVSAAQSASFQAGIEAYEQGDYATAKTEFSNALETNETAATRHNLALAELQLENPAAAVWQLERALLLDPFNQTYREKLNLVRQQLELSATTPKWYFRIAQLVSPGAWMMIATLSFWPLLAILILPRLNQKKASARTQLACLFSLFTLALSCAAIWQNFKYLRTGIVVSDETRPLHAAQASAAPEIGFVRPGQRARVLDRHNNFYQVRTESSATGWISKDDFRPLVFSRE